VITAAIALLGAGVAVWDLAATAGTLTVAEIGTDLYYIVVAVILVPAALGLLSGRGWARSVVATAHILLVLSMVALAGYLGWLVGIPLVLSLTTLACLASPSARRWVADNSGRVFSEPD